MTDGNESEAVTEPNRYLATLEHSRDSVIPRARDAVDDGGGRAGDAAQPMRRTIGCAASPTSGQTS